jgi:hypothetical protein
MLNRGPLSGRDIKSVPAKRKDSDYNHCQNAPYRHSFRAIRILSCHRRTSLNAVSEWVRVEIEGVAFGSIPAAHILRL